MIGRRTLTCSLSAMSQNLLPSWFPHWPTWIVTSSRGMAEAPSATSLRATPRSLRSRRGRRAMRRPRDAAELIAPFVASKAGVAERVVQLASVGPEDVFFGAARRPLPFRAPRPSPSRPADLGCGNAAFLIEVARLSGCRCGA